MGWTTASLLMAPLATLAILAAIPPLIIHLSAKNFAASVLILGVTILNVQSLINAILWHSVDVAEWWDGRILCDIEVKLYYGLGQATVGAIASIFRQIAIILHPDYAVMAPSSRQRKITLTIDLILCVVLPVYVMVGHYLTQRSRYWINVSSGCAPTFDINYAAPFLTYLWPFVVSLIGSSYCLVSIIRLYRHRKQMSSVFSTAPGVSHSRFFRLFALALSLLAMIYPVAGFSFVQNVRIPMHIYSWSHIHPPDWPDRIFLNVPGPARQQIGLDRWAPVVSSFFCFASYGLGDEATQMYRGWVTQTKRWLSTPSKAKRRFPEQPPVALRSIEAQVASGSTLERWRAEDQDSYPYHSHISELSA